MVMRRSLSIVALLLASACSGAASMELFDPISQGSSPAAPIVGRNDDGSSSTSGASSGGPSLPTPPPPNGGSSGGSSGADASAPPPPPVDACIVENEPNDGPEQTEWFTECFKGAVKKGDVDYASISAPATATKISIAHKETGGDVRYRVYVNGISMGTVSDDPGGFVPVFGGGTYSFEMTPVGTSSAARKYQLTVTFE